MGDRHLTRGQAQRLGTWRGARGKSLFWQVTWNTSQYPWKAVARPHVIDSAGYILALNVVLLADTVADLRELLPEGLLRLSRDPFDDPSVIERWI